MNRKQSFVFGILAGAGVMYLLDPDRGRRRRALMRDQIVHGGNVLGEWGSDAAASARDLGNRARGMVAEAAARLRPEEADDPVVEARVRSELGRSISHPATLHVLVENGHVTLTGDILTHEVEHVLASVASVRGVRGVQNQMRVHEDAGNIPGLQGTR